LGPAMLHASSPLQEPVADACCRQQIRRSRGNYAIAGAVADGAASKAPAPAQASMSLQESWPIRVPFPGVTRIYPLHDPCAMTTSSPYQ
jgi:hypothetical protein